MKSQILFILTCLLSISFVKAGENTNISTTEDSSIANYNEIKESFKNGSSEFAKIFKIKSNQQVSYKVTINYGPDVELASQLEKSNDKYKSANPSQDKQIKKMLHANAQRVRDGYSSISLIDLITSISDTNGFIINDTSSNNWNMGNSMRFYVKKDSLIAMDQLHKIVTISSPQMDLYPSISSLFPNFLNLLGFNVLQNIMSKFGNLSLFAIYFNNYPLNFSYSVDRLGKIVNCEVRNCNNVLLRSAKYNYTDQDLIWPSNIICYIFSSTGEVKFSETWDLQSKKTLPMDFSFTPIITKDYRVIDKTGANIPQDEISRLLKQ